MRFAATLTGIFAFALASALATPAPAQTRASESAAEYSLREWHGSDGLPDEVVQAVVQDARGYLWVATEGGVVRFNGLRFDPAMPPADASGLAGVASVGSRGVPAMVNHAGHGLLLAFGTGEIWQWSEGAFRRAPVADLFSKGRIASWFVQANGALWADFSDGRMEYLHEGRVTKVNLGHSLLAGRSITFADDGGGGVWIAARAALYHLRAADAQAAKYSGGASPEINLAPVDADFAREEICVTTSRRGAPWIIAGNILGRWNGARIENPLEMPRLLGAHFVHDLVEDHHGNLWVGTRSQGAYVVNAGGGECRFVPASHRTVRHVCEDTEGNIWLATNGGGLDRLQSKRFRLYDSSAGLDDDLTFTVAEDRAGNMWLANRDGGMVRVRNGKIVTNPAGWPVVSAGRVYPDNDGGVWFTAGSGLFKTDPAGDRQRRALDPAPFKNMRVLFVSRANELWIGGDAGELGRVTDSGFVAFGPDKGFPARQRPGAIVEDAAGRIIVGTNNGGLFRCDPAAADPRFEPLRAAGAAPLAAVRSLLIDEHGTLWIGTGGAGVWLITPGKHEHHLGKDNGLPDEMISQMLFDDHGRVWFGSSHGIFSADRAEIAKHLAGETKDIHTSTFGQNEGLDHITCLNGYQPHCWKARDGTLWFTTRRGALAIDPHILAPGHEPPVYIDTVLIDEKNADLSRENLPLRIRSDTRRIEILFSALNLTAPELTAVRYRLKGFDSSWLLAGSNRQLVYPRLYPGEYELQIDAADEEGKWNPPREDEAGAPPDATLTLMVEPFWWETLWFRVALAILAAAALVAAVRAWSYRRLRRRLERSEREASIARERTRIARDIHDELGASLTRISLLSQCTAGAPDASPGPAAAARREADQRDCLDEIYSATTSITRSINEIVWAIDARHDNLESMVSYFDSYAQRFLTLAKIRYRLRAPGQLPALPISSRVRHDIFLAFKETLNNCAKYSAATEVLVTVGLDARDLAITVSDNGRGIAAGAAPGGGGQGLANLAHRLSAIGGRARVSPAANGGTEVAFTIPLTKLTA